MDLRQGRRLSSSSIVINILRMYDDGSFSPLLRQLPQIRRARDYRLYTGDGRRLIDLWQYGGRAVLGHTIPRQLRELKNSASRGLFVPFPNHFEGRLEKAFRRLFPERVMRIYNDTESLREGFKKVEFTYPPEHLLPDPAFGHSADHHTTALWRPFLDDAKTLYDSLDILLPVLPFSWMSSLIIVLLKKTVSDRFPPSDLVSSVISSGLLASVLALMRQSEKSDHSGLTQNLAHTSWQHRGIYLANQYCNDDGAYEKMFVRFLNDGFLIPPKKTLPLILPVKPDSLSHGELIKLSGLLNEFGN